MKFCQSCGQENVDDARFCESCGAAMPAAVPQAGAGPAASHAGSSPAVAGMSSQVQALLQGRGQLIAVAAVALVVLIGVWAIFFRPMTASVYEDRADKYGQELMDAQSAIESEIGNYYQSSDSSEDNTVSESEWRDTREAIDSEVKKMKKAAGEIKALRPPAEYKSADERLVAWADFYANVWGPAIQKAAKDISAGNTFERVTEKLGEYDGFLDKSQQRELERVRTGLSRASRDIDLSWWGDGGE